MIISIHQPNYIPWAGYFHKIASSDIFVIFDDVQLPRGKDFVVRNLIKTEGGPKWMRVPVKNQSKMLPINEIEINNDLDWQSNHLNSLYSNYQKTSFFTSYYYEIEKILNKKYQFLIDLNLELIKLFMKILKIKTKIVYSSKLNINDLGTEKILKIIQQLNGDKYLTGQGKGSKRYIEGKENIFQKNNIEIIFQKFKIPQYSQLFNEFIPNLSICDMLFNIGSDETQKIIETQNINN